jgi:hypothetical protein
VLAEHTETSSDDRLEIPEPVDMRQSRRVFLVMDFGVSCYEKESKESLCYQEEICCCYQEVNRLRLLDKWFVDLNSGIHVRMVASVNR